MSGTGLADDGGMADEPKTEATPPAAEPKRSPVVFIIVAVVGALAAGAGGAWFGTKQAMKNMPKAPPAAAAAAGEGHEAAAPEPEEEEKEEGGEHGEGAPVEKVVTMQPFVVNLEDETGDARFLKVTIAVELMAAKHHKAFDRETPKVRSAVLMYLGNLKLANTQGSANKKKIIEQVHAAVADVVGKNKIRDVYLTEFVIQ